MAVCPLLSKVFLDESSTLTPGSGSHSKGNYSIESPVTGLAIVWMDCIGVNCRFWDATHSECSIPTNNLFTYHIHDSHEHPASHAVGTVPASGGQAMSPPPEQSKASLLSQEYMTGEDTDGNSEVLGKDFGLNVTDSDVPKMLLTILNAPDFPVGLTTYTWAEYLATLP
jgi:hypothetical protein